MRDYLAGHGIESRYIHSEDGTKANLWATIGPDDQPGVILSGHTDVVPVDGQPWQSDPFVTREAGGRLTSLGGEDTIYGVGAVATNGHIHDALLALLSRPSEG